MGAISKRRILTYLAPDTVPTTYLCRVLRIPDDLSVITAVNDSLAYLTGTGVWEVNDTVSDADMQMLMSSMMLGYFREDCVEPVTLVQEAISAQHVLSNGTQGGTTVANAWTIVPFNLVRRVNTSDGVLTSNVLTIPPGTWHIRAKHALFQSSGTNIQNCAVRLKEQFGIITHLHVGTPIRGAAGVAVVPEIEIVISAIMDTDLSLEYRTNVAQATSGLGGALNQGMDENYGEILCTRSILVTP